MPDNALIDSWKLVSLHAESDSGEIFKPYGESPAGMLMYMKKWEHVGCIDEARSSPVCERRLVEWYTGRDQGRI
jgi:hypothetical protein